MVLLNRDGQQGNVYQRRNLGTWNPQLPAYRRFWMKVLGGERKRKTIPLGRCGAKWIACARLRESMLARISPAAAGFRRLIMRPTRLGFLPAPGLFNKRIGKRRQIQ